MTTRIRVMVVEDHHVVRQGLVALLKTTPDMSVVAEGADGRQAVDLFRQHEPDVTLMDLRMPNMSGVDAVIEIRQHYPAARIIVLTTFDGDEDIYRALQAGARAYLLKGMFGDELMDAIRAVHAGKSRIPPAVAERLANRMSGPALTVRELDVLRLIVLGKSNKEIGEGLTISEATVKTHINSDDYRLAARYRSSRSARNVMRQLAILLAGMAAATAGIQAASDWRAATEGELKKLIPARASVAPYIDSTNTIGHRTMQFMNDSRDKMRMTWIKLVKTTV